MKDQNVSITEQLEALKEELTRETHVRETDIHELREVVGGEKLARVEHRSSIQDLVLREQAASQKITQELLASYEAQHGEVMNHLALEKGVLSTLHNSVEERVSYFEQLLIDSVDHHNAIKDHSCSIGEQLDALREELTRGIAQLQEVDIHELRGMVSGEKLARAEHHSSLQDLRTEHRGVMTHLALERGALSTHHAAVEERVSYLEKRINGSMCCHAMMKDHQASVSEQLEALREELTRETGARQELCQWVLNQARPQHHSSLDELSMAFASPWKSTALPTPHSPRSSSSGMWTPSRPGSGTSPF